MGFNLKKLAEENSLGGTYEAIPEDRYICSIEGGKAMESNAGKKMLNIEFAVIDGTTSGEKYKGRKLWKNFMLEGAGTGFLIGLLRAAKSDLITRDEELSEDAIIADLTGKKVSLLATVRVYQDKEQNDVEKFVEVKKSVFE